MKNRISDDLLASDPPIPRTPTATTELLNSAQKQLDQGRRAVEMYVQEHPAVGIGAAFCIGVLIGWISKRK